MDTDPIRENPQHQRHLRSNDAGLERLKWSIFVLFLTLLSFVGAFREVRGQAEPPSQAGQRVPLEVTMYGLYEQVEVKGLSLKEASFPLAVSIPFTGSLSFHLRGSGAAAQATGAGSLSGFNDANATLRFSRRMVSGRLVVDLGVNLPSGKKELSLEEFDTTVYLSQPFFAFQSPGFGQGFNLYPSAAWAFTLSPNVVMGIMAQYRFKGSYAPVEAMVDLYDPGDEVKFSAGLDVRLSAGSTLSGDAALTLHGKDRVGNEEVFQAGDKLSFKLMYRQVGDLDEFRATARYLGRDRGSAFSGSNGVFRIQTLPDLAELVLFYSRRVARPVFIGLSISGQRYGASSLYEVQNLGVVRLLPAYSVNERLDLLLLTSATFGSFTGFDAGFGFSVRI